MQTRCPKKAVSTGCEGSSPSLGTLKINYMDHIKIFARRVDGAQQTKELQEKIDGWLEKNGENITINNISSTFSPDGDGDAIFAITLHYIDIVRLV